MNYELRVTLNNKSNILSDDNVTFREGFILFKDASCIKEVENRKDWKLNHNTQDQAVTTKYLKNIEYISEC